MQVPVNDLARGIADDRADIDRALSSVLDGGWLIHGAQHVAFEAEFAAFLGSQHVIGVGNGTDALTIALRAVGVSPGDRVCTVANAGFYTSSACLQLGAIPVYVDVDAARLGMDPTRLSAALRHEPSAVVVTHLYGGMADVEAIAELCLEHGIPLIEDCAQATGARTTSGRAAGTIGALGTFSFYPTKNLAALGDGGAISTADDVLAERCRELRQYGWRTRYAVGRAGFNSRLDELQAAVLRGRLAALDARNERRRQVCREYNSAITGHPEIRPATWDGSDHVGHLAVIRWQNRERLQAHLEAAGLGTAVHYPIADDAQPIWEATDLTMVRDDLAETRRATHEVLSLPCFPELEVDEIQFVAETLAAFS